MKHLLAATAVLLCGFGKAFAAEDFLSANYLMSGCRAFIAGTGENYIYAGVCLGTVETVAHQWRQQICIPQGVTYNQAIKVVMAYIDARPARLHENFSDLAGVAMVTAWPCRQP
jgi:hypothetical protein